MAIRIKKAQLSYPQQSQAVLDIESFSLAEGEMLCLQGLSGSGKTSLLNLISGIHKPHSGEVLVLDNRLDTLSEAKLDRFRVDHMGIVFQQFNLIKYLSVLENVLVPCWFSKIRARRAKNPEQQAKELLSRLSIPEQIFTRPANNLSIGQQQRVALARALIGKPQLILADEPTSALDGKNTAEFMDLLLSQVAETKASLVFVSHDKQLAAHFPRVIDISSINKA